jgi:hypothetical protein
MANDSSIIPESKHELMEKAEKLGFDYEKEAHYCPQAALAAIMDVLHFRDDTLFKSCFGFHGGGGDSNIGICGALAAGVTAISYFFGRTRSEFDLKVPNCQATGIVKRLHEYIEEEYGGVRCCDVQKKMFGREFRVWDNTQLKEFLDMGAHEKQCPVVVGRGAGWAVGLIIDEMKRKDRIKRTIVE